jgi:gluconokinase
MSGANLQVSFRSARLIVVMGVSGCGKSTVGAALAGRMNKSFIDADDYHPKANLVKMSHGIPLDNDDRWPWLERIGKVLGEHCRREGMVICACSALLREYREHLKKAAGEPILFVYLNGGEETISRRLCVRSDHFMPTELLDSQFSILEAPTEEENVLSVEIDMSVSKLAAHIHEQILIASDTDK